MSTPLSTPVVWSKRKRLKMKTKSFGNLVCAAFFLCLVVATVRGDAADSYTVHEWGTFTSVQGGNGELLFWHPLRTSELPRFVHKGLIFKGGLSTLQRMETPVIYFYADQPMTADVDITFPKGVITEWYPQATQIDASHSNSPSAFVIEPNHAVWHNIQILPESNTDAGLRNLLTQDTSGNHYFAARATSANILRANVSTPTNGTSEIEKFIFYRGAGSFKTPLRVTVDSNDIVSVENTGAQPLAHLFLVSIHDGHGAFAVLDELSASNSVRWLQISDDSAEHWSQFPLPQFQTEIGAQVQTALTSEGLFPDEANAMVNTWKDSWFAEDGVRVLYLLPRPWTDEILPLKLNPQSKELTRVMVGRAEVITPKEETALFQLLTKAQNGDGSARIQAANELTKLGRFAEPALRLASAHAGPPDSTNSTGLTDLGYQLLRTPSPVFK